MTLTKNDKLFIEHVKQQCKYYGVKCDLRNTRSVVVGPKQKASGYFDEVNRELVCSMLRPDSLGILVHEYCHLTQWAEQATKWLEGTEGYEKMNNWLNGKEYGDIEDCIKKARDLELDNEKRAVKVIKKWKLSIDIPSYVKRANAYIQFYNYLPYTRKWSSPSNSPYTNKRLLAAVPGKFSLDYTKLSKKLYKIFKEENI